MKEVPSRYEHMVDNPIIVALDKAGKEGAIQIIKKLGRRVWGYKLGALLLQYGAPLIGEIKKEVSRYIGGSDVSLNFLIDLQFTGTSDFIREAISSFSLYSNDISFIVVNASSGPESVRVAVETARLSKILVGAPLDSLRTFDVQAIYGTSIRQEKALQFALMGKQEGAAGLCCSVIDLEFLSQYQELKDFKIYVYGVRLEGDLDHGTHKFVMTPKEVKERGADKFIMGRPIRDARNKIAMVNRILKEVQKAKQR